MDDIRFYLSVFLRRLPWFLVVATIIWAISFAVAMTLPPAYVSKMRLVVESPQIPEDLAASTVKTPALEQLQIIEQRLLTRDNLLALSRRFDVPPARDEMNPDEIVDAMRARTTIRMTSGRNEATMMTVSFEAANPRRAAAVLNEYLTLIQAADAQFRRGRSGETLDFFRQEVQRLDEELEAQSNRILEFKQKNAEALPESLEFRMSQRASLQERLSQNDREIVRLRNQRERLIQLFEATGGTDTDRPDRRVDRSPAQQQLLSLEAELTAALAVYSEENPKVKLLRNQIAQVSAQIEEERVQAVAAARTQSDSAEAGTDAAQGEETPDQARREMLNIQLSEIDGEINLLQTQQKTLTDEIAALDDTISRTPAVAIALDELQRAYDIIEAQYSSTEARLSQAQTGDLIETRSRGQRISVIEQPNVPSEPTKPNRVKIAGAGGALGLLAGVALVLLLEVLNTSVRRPEDLVNRFGISPFTTIPYIRTRKQIVLQRGLKLLLILAILLGIPAMIYAMHVYYLPIDLVAEKVMNKLGVRW